MPVPPAIYWFRRDLRLADNPALVAAVARGGPVIPVFIWSPEEEGTSSPGAASRWWLHRSLESLDAELQSLGSRLIIRAGSSSDVIRELIDETGATAVYWNRSYEPDVIKRDAAVEAALRTAGVVAESFGATLLHEPSAVRTKQGKPYQVFTPFWKACRALGDPEKPLPAPHSLLPPSDWPDSLPLSELKLEPTIDWAGELRETWTPGTAGAHERLQAFLDDAICSYDTDRDIPSVVGTSRLSPHLHFGEISPRAIWHAVNEAIRSRHLRPTNDVDRFLAEIGWREFAHHVLYHFPRTVTEPLREPFERFPWQRDKRALQAWQRGRTGFPIVDAGMRELWATGWMHNRVRMLVGSFLTKDLLISWREGAAWFHDTLVDADLANNTLGWQWVSGCGADAAPYFRIFNPTAQGKKFDPEGEYVRQWVPELAALPDRWIHEPSAAPQDVLDAAGVRLGETYPLPIVDHGEARRRALELFATIKR